jgi:serine/threonine-protein kinase
MIAELGGKLLHGKYRVTDFIAEGGMGTVLEGQDLDSGRPVAIKVLRAAAGPTTVRRFQREIRIARAIAHPNVCAIYDSGTLDNGHPFLVMERLYGDTVKTRLRAAGPMALREAVAVLQQTLSALEAAHDAGIVHRDIKPGNIFLVSPPGALPSARLIDFGLARFVTTPRASMADYSVVTQANVIIGTPSYMAPEQISGEKAVDERVDIWSCGLTLYELLAGRRPFGGTNPDKVASKIMLETPMPLSVVRRDLPSQIDVILGGAIAKNRDQRYRSAKQFRAVLAEFMRAVPHQAPPRAPAPSVSDATTDVDVEVDIDSEA